MVSPAPRAIFRSGRLSTFFWFSLAWEFLTSLQDPQAGQAWQGSGKGQIVGALGPGWRAEDSYHPKDPRESPLPLQIGLAQDRRVVVLGIEVFPLFFV